MHRIPTPFATVRSLALAAVALAAASASLADSQYDKERAACASGGSQDRATCLKEAGAAQAERRKGTADTYGSHKQNAEARCSAVAAADKTDCMARVDGAKSPNRRVTKSGSVAGGGVLKETVTTIPAPPTGSAPASASSASK